MSVSRASFGPFSARGVPDGDRKRWKGADVESNTGALPRGWEAVDDDYVPESVSVVDPAPGLANGIGHAGLAAMGAGAHGGVELTVTTRELYEKQEGSGGAACPCCRARFGSRISSKNELRAKQYQLFYDMVKVGMPLENIAQQVAKHHNTTVRVSNLRNGRPCEEWTEEVVLRHIKYHLQLPELTHVRNLNTLRVHVEQLSDSVYTRDGVTGKTKVNNRNFRDMILAMKQQGQEHARLTQLLDNQRHR